MVQLLEKQYGNFSKLKTRITIWSSNSTLGTIQNDSDLNRYLYIHVHGGIMQNIQNVKAAQQTKESTKRAHAHVRAHTQECRSAWKRKATLTHATTWMSLEDIMTSEKSHAIWSRLKSFCTAKKTVNKMKRQPTKWEKIFANHLSSKRVITKIFKELIYLSKKTQKTKNQKQTTQITQLKNGPRNWTFLFNPHPKILCVCVCVYVYIYIILGGRERETLISCFQYAPRPGIKPTTFDVQDNTPTNWVTLPGLNRHFSKEDTQMANRDLKR